MEFTCFILFFIAFFSNSYSNDEFFNRCVEGKFINSFCKCENIASEHASVETQIKISCSGNKSFQAVAQAINTSKEKEILIQLYISNVTIDSILYHDLKNLSPLWHLNIIGCYISNIENNAFKEQILLEVLDLSMNQLTLIKNYMFDPLKNLKNLSLANNQIHFIESTAFHELSLLQSLDLSSNDLKMVDTAWFAEFKSLETLSLSNNQIKSLESNTFQHLLLLQKLDLSFNDLKEIATPTFFRLKSLKILSLAMNELETLNESVFKGNTMMEKVNLTGNLWNCDKRLLLLHGWLKKYEATINKEGAFCMNPPEFQNFTIQHGLDVVNLEISVQDSPLCNASMCNCTIAREKIVVTVDCSKKGFSRLPATLPLKTRALDLSFNNIKSLTIEHIDTKMWAEVSFLYLNSNSIDSLKGIEGTWLLRNLVVLHLSNNYITEIPIYVLEHFRGSLLDEIELSGNPWKCDCNTVRFQTWLQDNYKAIRDLESLLCSNNNGVLSNQVIAHLSKSQLCPQHEELVNYLDVLNGLMAVAIILIVVKLAYDYQLQKRTGKLPRFFSLNLS